MTVTRAWLMGFGAALGGLTAIICVGLVVLIAAVIAGSCLGAAPADIISQGQVWEPDAGPAPSSSSGTGMLDMIELVGIGPTTETIELSRGDWIASVEGNEYIEGQAYVFVVDLHGYDNGGTVQIANEVAGEAITSEAVRVGQDIREGRVLVVVTAAAGARWAVLLTQV